METIWESCESGPTIFSLSVASSIWRITLQRSSNQESNSRKDQIAADTRWDLYLGQIQKLMKKSTIGDPGMWRRLRTLKVNGALSSVDLFWPPECAARTRLPWRWCRWPKPGTSSPQPGFNMRRKQGMQIERNGPVNTPIWPRWKATKRRASVTETAVTGIARGLPPSLVAIRCRESGKPRRLWVMRSWSAEVMRKDPYLHW